MKLRYVVLGHIVAMSLGIAIAWFAFRTTTGV